MASIVLAILILILLGVVTYRSLDSLVSTVADESQPNQKLILLKETQYSLADAELTSRTYSITGDYSALTPFYDNINESRDKLEQILKLGKNTDVQKYRIKQIKRLIKRRVDLMDQLVKVKEDTASTSADLQKVRQQLNGLNRPNKQQEDGSSEEKLQQREEKQRGFFKRLFNKNNNDQTEDNPPAINDQKDENPQHENVQNKRALTRVMLELDNITKAQRAQLQEKANQEYAIIEEDKKISMDIREIIEKINRDEERNSLLVAKKARASAGYATMLIFILLVITVLVLTASGIAVYSYIKANQRYRKVLSEAKLRAEKLARLRLDFLSNMSHEIRTPLNAIVGFSEQLGKQKLMPEQEQSVRIIKESSEHLSTLINDVLDHAKMESGKFNFEFIAFKPMEVFQQVFDFFSFEAHKKGIEISLFYINNIPEYIVGDSLRLKQILLNLMSNALKFTSKGFVKMEVSALSSDDKQVVINIKVSDSGIGIAPEKQLLIFEEYTQAEENTTRKYGGTGLGLTITRKLIELQGGSIEVTSRLNEGTSFSIVLPFGIDEEAARSSLADVKFKDMAKVKALNILVADDENYNRLLLQHIFDKWDLQVDMAVDGLEVLDQLSVQDYDLILMDVKMPYLDGITATQRIRESFSGVKRSVPIVAITAGALHDVKKSCLDAGMNGFITKPFKEAELVKIMAELLKLETEILKPALMNVNNEAPQNGKPAAPNVDLAELKELTGNDTEFLNKMIHTFIESSQQTATELQEALANKNYTEVKLLGHRLAAPARHMGFVDLAGKLKRIERYETENIGLPELAHLINEVIQEICLVNTLLKDKING